MLRLLFDQHASGEVHDRLAQSDRFDIERVREVNELGPMADDNDIWRYAVKHDRVILTNDADFVDGTADPSDGTHPGVIRYTDYDWAAIAEAIEVTEQMTTNEEMAENRAEFHIPTGWV